jgi:hypothetical protein
MRLFVALVCVSLASCANAESPSVQSDASKETSVDSASEASTEADVATDETGEEEIGTLFDADEIDTFKGHCATPAGTVATATSSYMSTPDIIVDGSLSTIWNSGGYTGTVRLAFPSAISLDRIRVAANALPDTDETYTITGFSAGAPTSLGSFVRHVTGSNDWVAPIEVSRGTYDEILIDIGTSASWITLAEVMVYDSSSGCVLP